MATAFLSRSSVTNATDLIVPGALLAAMVAATVAAASTGWQGVLSFAWLALVAVAWRSPVVGLAVVGIAMPFEQRLSIPTLAGDLTAAEFTVWAVALGAVPRLIRDRCLVWDRVATLHFAVVVTLVTSVAAGSVRLPAWWEEVQGWLLSLLVFVVARSTRSGFRSRGLVLLALAAAVVANAVAALGQRSTGAGPESFVVDGVVRVFGTFRHPNTLAAFLAIVLPVFVALSITKRGEAVWVWRIAAVTGTATLLLTQSRGGMLSFAAATIVLLALAPRRIQRWVAGGALAGAVLVAATGSIEHVPAIDRFSNITPTSGPTQVAPETWGQLEREAHWGAAWSMLRSDPLFGVGAGQFNGHFREHTPEWRFRIGRWHAHNGYLQLGSEAGVPGAAAFVGWIGTILVALWRRLLRTSGADYLLAAGALGAAVAWTVNNVFEYQDVSSTPITFALVVAIGLGGVKAMGSAPVRAEPAGDVP